MQPASDSTELDAIFAESFRASEQLREEDLERFQGTAPKQTMLGRRKRETYEELSRRVEAYRAHYNCPHCGNIDSVIDDAVGGQRVCTAAGCGRVLETALFGDRNGLVEWFPPRPVGSTYRRTTHANERISQLHMREPAIEARHRDAIMAAYDVWRQLPDFAQRRARYDDPADADERARDERYLSKGDVSAILQLAGLEKRSLLEKWITIRYMCTRYVPRPMRPDVYEAWRDDFRLVSAVWNAHESIRTLDGHVRRQNIINLNFIFAQLLLFHGNEVWQRHRLEFPQVGEAKREELFRHWLRICKAMGRTCRVAVMPVGEILRRARKQKQLKQLPPLLLPEPHSHDVVPPDLPAGAVVEPAGDDGARPTTCSVDDFAD